jgi:virginiamycin A acetyltransferase
MRGSRLVVGENVTIDAFVKIKFVGGLGDVLIGADSYINSGVVIYSGNGVHIGKGSMIAANTTIAATNHEFRARAKTILEQRFMPSRGGVVVEEDVWVGVNCALLDGAVLRKGCVVGAGSVVNCELPAYSISVGTPARTVGFRE